MSDTYTTRRGLRRRGAQPSGDVYALPTREAPDDDARIYHVAAHERDGLVTCSDCGRGHLVWAEAGYVAWHRICDVCGSHWDEHPCDWYVIGGTLRSDSGATPETQRLRELVTPEHVARAIAEAVTGSTPIVHAAWAQRARLYR